GSGSGAPRPVPARREAGCTPELTVEGRQIVEAAIQSDGSDRIAGAAQPYCGTAQPRAQHVLPRCYAHDLLEQAQEVKGADRRFGGELSDRQARAVPRLDAAQRPGDPPLIP